MLSYQSITTPVVSPAAIFCLCDEGFWRCDKDALLASYQDDICRLEDRLAQSTRSIYTTQQASLGAAGQGHSGVALLEGKGTDIGLLVFGLAKQMLQSGR